MQNDRTIAVNVNDLRNLAYMAAQGILLEAEQDFLRDMPNEADLRAELGQMLAMAYGHANVAANATSDEDTALPYDQTDILDALAGKLTARPLFA
jgi:hypothetical protein